MIEDHKSSFRRLAELTDRVIREQFKDEPVYYINQGRLDNMLWCLEQGAKIIKDLEAKVKELEFELSGANLELDRIRIEEEYNG